MSKILAALAIVAGSLAVIFDLLSAFNIADLSDAQRGAVGGALGLLLLVLGVWFHPSTSLGPQAPVE